MSRVVKMKVVDWRPHPHRKDKIEVKVKVPVKDGLESDEWFEPHMHEIKRRFRPHGGSYDVLIGQMVRIPELEVQAEKMGYDMCKRRRFRG